LIKTQFAIELISVSMSLGQSSSPDAQSAGAVVELLADIGWKIATSSSAVTSSRRDVTGDDVTGGRLPLNVGGLSARAQDLHRRVKSFIEEHVLPVEQDVLNWHCHPQTKWTTHPTIQQLKVCLCAGDL